MKSTTVSIKILSVSENELESLDNYFTKENLIYIEKGIEQIRKGQVIIHDLIEDYDDLISNVKLTLTNND